MSPYRSSLRFLLINSKRNNSTRNAALRFTHSRSLSSQTPLESAGVMASCLKSRSVISFRGPETSKFLQGLLTNDLRRFQEDLTSGTPTTNMPTGCYPPIYAAMLTPQGRFLYDLFLYRPGRLDMKLDETGSGPGGKPEEFVMYADVDGTVVDELLQTLNKYRLRSKVEIENLGQEYHCWQHYGGKVSDNASSAEEPGAANVGWGGNTGEAAASSALGNDDGWQWHRDPRLSCLGFRGVFPSNSTPPLVEADEETDEGNYLLWRLEKGVAEGSTEIPKGEAIPLEYNLAGLNAISFDKGCYVGQELVARTHHRGVIRKRLLPLKFVNDHGQELEQRVAPGSEITVSDSGKKVGTVTTALGSRGLGLLRLEEALKSSTTSLVVEACKDVKVEVIRPHWWPLDWFLGH
ncbi:hypothetical protein V2J09_007666 [Rumex salicifolius]